VLNKRTGKPFILSSKNYLEWEEMSAWEVKQFGAVRNPVCLTCTFYPSTRRSFDLSNKLESIQDMLVHAGILEDDSYKHIPQVHAHFGEVDKDNPRVVIILKVLP
jgi:Holliday junction resolvase RusA-like endonuclease